MSITSLWSAYGWLLSSTCIHQPETYDIGEHKPQLLSLPDELLVDILVQLNCSTIFQARATCRRIHQLSESRHLWLRVVHRLQLEQGLAPPEQDVSTYGIRELERWVWRRTTALSRATTRPLVQPHVRLLNIEDDDELYLAEPYLLPGGRWLLLAHSVLGMLLYDLDHVEPIRKCLFNPLHFDESLGSGVQYHFWFDHSKPYLSFYVAGNTSNEDVTRTLIYAVWLEGKGPEATLTASLVAASRSPGKSGCYIEEFAFNKNYYIQISGGPVDSTYQYVKAYQLEKAPNNSYHRLAKPVAQITVPDDWPKVCR
ncbi:hypothetical protein NP233_g10104 [Leucocoprinus birnbaumii]|uniref:F-box domain-containing protein n=1 Tax=Leucocoprinus birnbaumii TaxID=56174 RepID=A0AAD5VJM6_9AGAR|nr:hypothetical protein NP233_g10104 [Leucocoprinus birnbaumii]